MSSIAQIRPTPVQGSQLPVSFELNVGQTDDDIKFICKGRGYHLFLTTTEVIVLLKPSVNKTQADVEKVHKPEEEKQTIQADVLKFRILGANSQTEVLGLEELQGKTNYFIGKDAEKWYTNVPTYAKVRYNEIYPGIDLVFYDHDGRFKYDFIVKPGGEPEQIVFEITGAIKTELDTMGNLILSTANGRVQLDVPFIYQESDAEKTAMSGGFVLKDNGQVGFQVVAYDPAKPLIIDPTLVYSTYIGGVFSDRGWGITFDTAGNTYVTGMTESFDFPCLNQYEQFIGSWTPFVLKLDPNGNLLYSTCLGGSNNDEGTGIYVDSSGNAYVTGYTQSNDFPLVNPLQSQLNGYQDAFVAKLSPAGNALLYSTYLGGSNADTAMAITLDDSGNVYLTGYTNSTDFPVMNPVQSNLTGIHSAFVTKINPSGTALIYSTYLGGSSCNHAVAIALDAAGNAYITGTTDSSDFPTVNAFQPTPGGGLDAFICKLNPNGSALVFSTYLGGSANDMAYDLDVDSLGNVVVTGQTYSANFPVLNPLQIILKGSYDAFVAKFNSSGILLFSTFLGGSAQNWGNAIAVGPLGNIYIAGATSSIDFPLLNPLQAVITTNQFDTFVTVINPTGSNFMFSTYLGGSSFDLVTGIKVDNASNIYLTGYTDSDNFPVFHAFQPVKHGYDDVIIVKISMF